METNSRPKTEDGEFERLKSDSNGTVSNCQNVSSSQIPNNAFSSSNNIYSNIFLQTGLAGLSKQSNFDFSHHRSVSNDNSQIISNQCKLWNDYMITLINAFQNKSNYQNSFLPYLNQDIGYLKKNDNINDKKDNYSTASDISTSSSSSSTCSNLYVNSNGMFSNYNCSPSKKMSNEDEADDELDDEEFVITNEDICNQNENLNKIDDINNSNEECDDSIREECSLQNSDNYDSLVKMSNSPAQNTSCKPFKHSIEFILGINDNREQNGSLLKRKFESKLSDESNENVSPLKKPKIIHQI